MEIEMIFDEPKKENEWIPNMIDREWLSGLMLNNFFFSILSHQNSDNNNCCTIKKKRGRERTLFGIHSFMKLDKCFQFYFISLHIKFCLWSTNTITRLIFSFYNPQSLFYFIFSTSIIGTKIQNHDFCYN